MNPTPTLYPNWQLPELPKFPTEGETKLQHIIYDKKGPIATIWFNRPEVKNCLHPIMMLERVACIADAAGDPNIRIILVRGKGGNFCAGADLANLVGPRQGKVQTAFDLHTFCGKMALEIGEIPKPVISIVEGYAVAGGFEFMMASDFVIATEDAKIGDFHINRGLIGGAGPLWSVPRVIGLRRAKELIFTGMVMSGKEALEWGLVNRAVPADKLDETVAKFCEPLLNKSPLSLHLHKVAISRALEADKNTIGVLEAAIGSLLYQSEDAQEGVRAFLEKRPAKWKGR
jgi:enoyl-CoA hydratase